MRATIFNILFPNEKQRHREIKELAKRYKASRMGSDLGSLLQNLHA